MMLRCPRDGAPPGFGCNTFLDSGCGRGGSNMCAYLKSLDFRYLARICAALSIIAAPAFVQEVRAQSSALISGLPDSLPDALTVPALQCMTTEDRRIFEGLAEKYNKDAKNYADTAKK